jgi:hypothetical protein
MQTTDSAQLLTFGGAFIAMFQPAKYAADLLPPEVERLTRIMGETSRGGIVIGTLGSCEWVGRRVGI